MKEFTAGAAPLKVMELFAGVGGFRVGLEAAGHNRPAKAFSVVWANQWEPGCKKQYAAHIYRSRHGDEDLVNRDINEVLANPAEMARIDALAPDMLVGGFPCQDYSVARPRGQSQGLEGKKGVLWWSIYAMLHARQAAGQPLKYLMFENVDRLVNSPSACKGRDFAIILASLQSLGYGVEWRVVNAADYGYPQRRRRMFILAYHRSTPLFAWLSNAATNAQAPWLTEEGIMAKALPARRKATGKVTRFEVQADVVLAQESYTAEKGRSRFASAGLCVDGVAITAPVEAAPIDDFTRFVGQVAPMTLRDVVSGTTLVPAEYLLCDADLSKWQYAKGAKSIPRTHASGFEYTFSEGALAFPDPLDRPSRTLITSEGGAAPSRTRHVVAMPDGRLRRLLPDELDVLNGFPRGFTSVPGVAPSKRAFIMGNALVVGLVEQLGKALAEAVLQ